ncbi:MAG TPA: hypothetical protein VHD90_12820 [Phototrophicaceae bacterium]|nr:hypothetical protein [Phototrophicaceae bacterium]
MAANLRQKIGELIGGAGRGRIQMRQINGYTPTRDFAVADYAFWDRARRAKARGLEISGLLLKPIGSKAGAWVLGDLPEWVAASVGARHGASFGSLPLQGNPSVAALNAWWSANHPSILRAYEEALDLGDAYLVINADLSVTVVPPQVVEPLLDAQGAVTGWRITETSADPTPSPSTSGRGEKPIANVAQSGYGGMVTVVDEYTAAERVRRVMRGGVTVQTTRYANLIGLIPVIHIANYVGADEFYGRPEGAALIPALQRYGELIDAAIRGNIRQGRPTPVIEKLGTADQVRKFWEKFGRQEKHTLPDGSSETVDVIDFDPDQLLTLGGEAQFKYAAPGSFSADTSTLLGLIYALIVEHSELPEFILGTAVSSSKASVETQMEPFVKWIEKKRGLAASWMIETARVALAYLAVTDFRIDPNMPLDIAWHALTESDGRLTLDMVTWAHGAGLIDDEGARKLLAIGS